MNLRPPGPQPSRTSGLDLPVPIRPGSAQADEFEATRGTGLVGSAPPRRGADRLTSDPADHRGSSTAPPSSPPAGSRVGAISTVHKRSERSRLLGSGSNRQFTRYRATLERSAKSSLHRPRPRRPPSSGDGGTVDAHWAAWQSCFCRSARRPCDDVGYPAISIDGTLTLSLAGRPRTSAKSAATPPRASAIRIASVGRSESRIPCAWAPPAEVM